MPRNSNRNAMLDERAEAREEEEMERWYEEQGKIEEEQQVYWEQCAYEDVITDFEKHFNDKIQLALEDTASTCGWIRGGTRVMDDNDDMIFIEKGLFDRENFDVKFNGPELEFYNVIMSGSDIISMNDIITTTNMMDFMEKYFGELDETSDSFIKDVRQRKDASYKKHCGSDYIMIRYIPKWKLTAEQDDDRRDEKLWEKECAYQEEIDRKWFLEDVREENERQEKIRQSNLSNVSEEVVSDEDKYRWKRADDINDAIVAEYDRQDEIDRLLLLDEKI